MIELGKVQELEIIRKKEFGVYLAEKEGMRRLFFSQRGRFRREPGLGTRWRCSSIKTHRTA